MKVLVAHNRYRSAAPSGENRVVDDEIAALSASGVQVVPMLEESDQIGHAPQDLLKAACGPVYAPTGARRFTELVERECPDIVHLHNVFPLISPQVVRIAQRRGIPVVQTVHNYRHNCVNGLHFRDGHSCMDCVRTKTPWPAVVHSCYRDSRLQTVPMALGQVLHRRTWQQVDRFLALTPFMAQHLTHAGVSPSQVVVRPSWVSDPGPTSPPGRALAYVGRLDEAKGLRLLLQAWRGQPDGQRTLVVAGDGPLKGDVLDAAHHDPSITYLGAVSPAKVADVLRNASGLIVPSLWFEGFPLTVVEAFSHGRPVVVTSGGSAASVVDESCGWVIPPDRGALTDLIVNWNDDEAARRGTAARKTYLERYTPQAAIESLLDIYAQLLRDGERTAR